MSRRRVGRDLEKVSLTINKELIAWVTDLAKKGVFASRSEAVSYAIEHLRSHYEKDGSLPRLPSV